MYSSLKDTLVQPANKYFIDLSGFSEILEEGDEEEEEKDITIEYEEVMTT